MNFWGAGHHVRVVIIGAGGHGQVVADILLAGNTRGSSIRPLGYLDDKESVRGHALLDLPVLGRVDDLAGIVHDGVVIAVGDNAIRRHLFDLLSKRSEYFVTACHPDAVLSASCGIGPGSVICAGVVVNPSAKVGANVILNTSCTVDHHNEIGDHAHIAPGVHLGGDVKIGEGALIGIGATVMPGRWVGAWSVVGAGALVKEDVLDRVVAVGSPARVLGDHEPGNIRKNADPYAVAALR